MKRTIYRDSRRPLHQKIAQKRLAGVTPTGETPQVTLLMGGSGVGKSTVLRRNEFRDLMTNTVMIDPDEIKTELPEWDPLVRVEDPMVAKIVHDESSDISKAVAYQAREQGLDIVIDGTGAGPSFMNRVASYKANGYKVKVLWVTSSIETALERVEQRRKMTGRALTESLVRLIHRDSSYRLPEIIGGIEIIDEVQIFENESEPVLIYERIGTEETTVDGAALERLWRKAEED